MAFVVFLCWVSVIAWKFLFLLFDALLLDSSLEYLFVVVCGFYHTDFKFNQWFVCVCDWFWCFKIDQSFTISHIVSAAIVVQSVFRCKSHYSVFRLSKTYFCSIDKLTCFFYSIVGIRFENLKEKLILLCYDNASGGKQKKGK